MRKESSQSSSGFHWEYKEHAADDTSAVVFNANKSLMNFLFHNNELLQTSANALHKTVILNAYKLFFFLMCFFFFVCVLDFFICLFCFLKLSTQKLIAC